MQFCLSLINSRFLYIITIIYQYFEIFVKEQSEMGSTSVHGNNSLNPKCDQCEDSKFKEAELPTPPFWKCARSVWRSSVRRAKG